MKNQTCLKVCDSCPWLRANHGKPHPAKWYSLANLRRLWNGLRRGKAPGMICHSSDPRSEEYGSTIAVKSNNKPRECAGALVLVIKHINEVNRDTWPVYRTKWGRFGISLCGLRVWVERYIFGGIPSVEDRAKDVAGPDEAKVTLEAK